MRAETIRKVDYFSIPRPLWRRIKNCFPKIKRSKQGGRPRKDNRTVMNGIWYVLWTGCQWKAVHRSWFGVGASVLHERFQTWQQQGVFRKVMKRVAKYYGKERGIKWKWQAIDSKSVPAPLGGEATGRNPTDRGKRGTKLHLLVDKRGAPLAVQITGANRHDKVAAIDLMVSIVVQRPEKRQNLCADAAYDAADIREAAVIKGYTPHIKRNPRSSKVQEPEPPGLGEASHPARRWVVERTLSWLTKRRSIRTRWSKKVENWLTFVQLACAHILFNMAVSE